MSEEKELSQEEQVERAKIEAARKDLEVSEVNKEAQNDEVVITEEIQPEELLQEQDAVVKESAVAAEQQLTKKFIKENKEADKQESPAAFPAVDINTEEPMLISGILFGSVEHVAQETNKKCGQLSREELEEEVDKGNTYLLRHAMLQRIIEDNHDQFEYLGKVLEELKKSHTTLTDILKRDMNDKVAKGSSFKGELKGTAARKAIFAAVRGIRLLYLYNSGFHIEIRPPSMSDLNQFYSSAQLQSAEFGHMVGANFLTMMDAYLKQKVVEFLPNITTGSNLVGWEQGNTLAENISIHDYDTILWGLCTLMYRDKELDLQYTCVSPECFYKKDNVAVNLDEVRFNNHSILTQDQIAYTMANDARTSDELEAYRKSIIPKDNVFKCESLGLGYQFHVPTLMEFVNTGIALIGQVVAKAAKSTTNKDVQLFNEYLLQLNQMFLPWVERVHKYDDTGEIQFSTAEQEAIMETLSIDLHKDTDLLETVSKFIRDTRITTFCYTALECPQCHRKPEEATVDGFTPVDVQSLFFDLTCRRLGIIE